MGFGSKSDKKGIIDKKKHDRGYCDKWPWHSGLKCEKTGKKS